MNVSPATTDDAPSILALQYLAYQTEAARYDDNTLPPLLEALADLLARFGDRRFLKAVEENQIIGSVNPDAVGWTAWYILHCSESEGKTLIGSVGACGLPDDDGSIVIGYSLLDQFHGQNQESRQ